MARVTETIENQNIVMWHWCRGKPSTVKNNKLTFVLNNVKIEKTYTFWYLTFIDPFTGKEVKIRKNPRNIQFVNPALPNGGIKGFEGFTDRPKRPKKRVDVRKANDIPLHIGPQKNDRGAPYQAHLQAQVAAMAHEMVMKYDPLVAEYPNVAAVKHAITNRIAEDSAINDLQY